MGEIKIEDRQIVVPGEILANGIDIIPGYGTYRLNENILASRLGVASVSGKVIKIVPLSGKYEPKTNDVVIGKVTDILMSGWMLDINCAYHAVLSMKDGSSEFIKKGADLTKYYDIEEYVVAQITNVTSQKLVDVSTRGPGLKKLKSGRIIKINSYKVPRVIGKKGSMVSLIKKYTDCSVIVGQNGVVWISGKPQDELNAIKAIRKIEDEAHISGLTERVNEFLQQIYPGKKVELSEER